jgi:hypothetical protein
MSRGDELREKFRLKGQNIKAEMDSPYGQFRSSLSSFVENECNAASNEDFSKKMYERYLLEKQADVNAWFLSVVKPMFVNLIESPRWLFEPSWSYDNGVPLAFLSQFHDDDGNQIYVFRGTETIQGSKQHFYKMLAQRLRSEILLDGKIGNPTH